MQSLLLVQPHLNDRVISLAMIKKPDFFGKINLFLNSLNLILSLGTA